MNKWLKRNYLLYNYLFSGYIVQLAETPFSMSWKLTRKT